MVAGSSGVRTLGVIPARGGSKGLPGKNVRPLGGKPLIAWSIEAARGARRLDRTIVSTDDAAIADVARAHGGDVPFLRPAEIATDTASVWLVLRHAVTALEAAGDAPYERIVLLQPTSPLRTAADIDRGIARMEQLGADAVVAVRRPHDNPYFNMVEVPRGGEPWARPVARIAGSRRQDAPAVYAISGALYVLTRSAVFDHDDQFGVPRYAILELPPERSVDIDAELDLAWAEFLLARRRMFPP